MRYYLVALANAGWVELMDRNVTKLSAVELKSEITRSGGQLVYDLQM